MKRIVLFLSLILFAGCTSTPQASMSPQQKRAIQARTFNTSFEMTFQAFKSVLQDDGYVIQNQDFAGGLIVAEGNSLSGQASSSSSGTGVSTSTVASGLLTTASIALAASGNGSGNTYIGGTTGTSREKIGEKYRLSVNFDKINSKTTETRLIIQTISQYSMGSETITEYLGEETYKLIYDKVNYEIKRRQALGR